MGRDWGQWAALFDPSRALGPDEIGALYQPRLRAPHAELARRLTRSRTERGVKAVILGSRGSGKSTELARLAHVVRDRWLSVRVDLAGAFDAGSSVVDLLVLLAASVERAARDWERPQTASRRALAQAVSRMGIAAEDFGQLVAALEPVAAVAGAPGGAAAASVVIRTVGTLTRKVLGALVRDGAAADQGALIAALNDATLDLRVAGLNDHPVLFLLEGLDKLTELDTIRSAFRDVDLLLQVDAPMVLAAPVAARHQPWVVSGVLQGVHLWNAPVVLHDDARTPNADGIDEIVGMYRLRARAEGAPPDLVAPGVLTEAARLSSGNAREFFRLLEKAMDRADEAGRSEVGPDELRHAVTERRHGFQLALRTEQLDLLLQLHRRPGLLPAGPEADELLYENFVACYPDDDAWFAPNEILTEYLRRLEAR